jgi:hypothetical protein
MNTDPTILTQTKQRVCPIFVLLPSLKTKNFATIIRSERKQKNEDGIWILTHSARGNQ